MAKHFGGTTMRIGSGTDTALISELDGELYIKEGGHTETIRLSDMYAAKEHYHSSGGLVISYDDLEDKPDLNAFATSSDSFYTADQVDLKFGSLGDIALASKGDYYAKADIDTWVITSGALALTSGSTEAYFTKEEIQNFLVGVIKQQA